MITTIKNLALTLALLTAAILAPAPLMAEQHAYNLWPIHALPLPNYLTQTAKDVLMVQVRLQKPGETFRLRVWYTCTTPDGVEKTYERRIDVVPADLWVTAAFGGYEPGEEKILQSAFVRVKFIEESVAPVIAESVSDAVTPKL